MGYQPKSPPSILKSANCPSHPFLGNSHLYIGFSWNPLKIGFFSEPPLTPSHLLKVTKFLVKISQFKFLVMTKKNSFVYKLFLLLNISDFSLVCLLCKICTTPPPPYPPPRKKSHPSFQQPPSKNWDPVKPSPLPFLKIWSEAYPCSRKGGVHTMHLGLDPCPFSRLTKLCSPYWYQASKSRYIIPFWIIKFFWKQKNKNCVKIILFCVCIIVLRSCNLVCVAIEYCESTFKVRSFEM